MAMYRLCYMRCIRISTASWAFLRMRKNTGKRTACVFKLLCGYIPRLLQGMGQRPREAIAQRMHTTLCRWL